MHRNTTPDPFTQRIYNPATRQYEFVEFAYKETTRFKLIPIELSISANLSAFPDIGAVLLSSLNPYIEAGLSYYFWQNNYETINTFNNLSYSYGDWQYFDIGMNIGFGADYSLKPKLAIWAGLKRYFVFTERGTQKWNMQFGVSLY